MANRIIKFRLLNPSKKIIGYEKWYEGSFNKESGIPSAKPCWLYSDDQSKWTTHPIKGRYKDSFTGLLDKNGKEIYEGDIVKIWSDIMPEWAEHKLLIQWWKDEARFSLGRRDARELIEIIGNIYENPELLDGQTH